MLPLNLKSNGQFLKRMQEREAKWKSSQISSTIHAPDELRWWYWQEFGTAASGDVSKGASGRTYSIDPVDANLLAYPNGSGTTIVPTVEAHPGIKPRRPVAKAMPEIEETVKEEVHQAFEQGAADDPSKLKRAVHDAVEKAKGHIVDSLAVHVSGIRGVNTQFPKQSGKLGGRSAASVFNEKTTIVDS